MEKTFKFLSNLENSLYSHKNIIKKLEDISFLILKFFNAKYVGFIYFNEDKKNVYVKYCPRNNPDIDICRHMSIIIKSLEKAYKNKEKFIFYKSEQIKINKLYNGNLFSLIPIFYNHKIEGYLLIHFDRDISFLDKKESEELGYIISYISTILSNYQIYKNRLAHIKEEYDILKLLYKISHMTETFTEINLIDSLLKMIKLIKAYIYHDYFSISLINEDGKLEKLNLGYDVDLLNNFSFVLAQPPVIKSHPLPPPILNTVSPSRQLSATFFTYFRLST